MPKVNIKRLDSTTANDITATKTINDNFTALQEGIDEALSRTGEVPNYMLADIDLNHNKLINLGDPSEDRDAVTLKYVKDIVGDAKQFEELAKKHAERADKAVDAANIYLQKTITASNKAALAAEYVAPLLENDNVKVVAENINDVKNVSSNISTVQQAYPASQIAVAAAEDAKRYASQAIKSLKTENIRVPTTLWTTSDLYIDFQYSAKIPVKDSRVTLTPTVIFDVVEATSGNFAPVAISEDEAVTIFAKEQPTADIVIPVIVLE